MKIALSLLTTVAIGQKVTQNNCFDEQGAVWLGECFGMFMNLCDEFKMLPGETCNILTFNNA
jgi:hypothetical protein